SGRRRRAGSLAAGRRGGGRISSLRSQVTESEYERSAGEGSPDRRGSGGSPLQPIARFGPRTLVSPAGEGPGVRTAPHQPASYFLVESLVALPSRASWTGNRTRARRPDPWERRSASLALRPRREAFQATDSETARKGSRAHDRADRRRRPDDCRRKV